MFVVRIILFNILFFLSLSFFLIIGLPLLCFDKKYMFLFWKKLSRFLDYLTQTVAGITYSIENPHNILNGSVIYAIRHESAWETLILIHLFFRPIFILKKELINIPIFGVMAKKVGAIDVDRENGTKALINAAKKVVNAVNEGYSVIIFPEGTRVSTGEHVNLKRGIALLYKKANCCVIPVVHNSGQFWPRHGFLKRPGSISLKFMDPILPGLSQEEFMEKLTNCFYEEVEKLKRI